MIELSPAAIRLVSVVADWQQFTGGTVATVVAAGLVGGWSVRTVRHYLAQAEHAGVLHRPQGAKSGWAVRGGSSEMVFNDRRAG